VLESDAVEITFDGEPATLRILRSDGCCWGRIITAAGEELDVQPDRDVYEYADDQAAEFLKRYLKRYGRAGTSAALGWTD
jgi:hypothetical protein